jgi:uncharacterized membrane protein YoaK (UPF0700 family)
MGSNTQDLAEEGQKSMPSRQVGRRNSAAMWKKLTIVISAFLAGVIVVSLLRAANASFVVLVVAVLAVVAAVVWMVAKVLGVHLSLSSWD